MNEMHLSVAIQLGIQKINSHGIAFKPNMANLLADFSIQSGSSGVIALPPEKALHKHHQGYDLIKLSAPHVPNMDITLENLWTCAKEHYGLTAMTAVTGIGGVPIKKIHLGHQVHKNSSQYTNLTSHYGHKFFPMLKLPHGSMAARVAKNTAGTVRVFGIVGRVLPFVAVGLAIYDVISIGMCAYEEQNEK